MLVQPYLHFDGRCEEALQFYRQALNAEIVMLLRYRESPKPPPPGMVPPGWEEKVMHANLRIGDSTVMASDDCTGTQIAFQGFQLCLTVVDVSMAEQRFAALAEGGQVKMSLTQTFFSPCFGMLVDRFGVAWMVIVPAAAVGEV
ncbi:MAG TPA: VOC family protein [Azospira sp.]|nr:VOC family protein [Azospira sp.]